MNSFVKSAAVLGAAVQSASAFTVRNHYIRKMNINNMEREEFSSNVCFLRLHFPSLFSSKYFSPFLVQAVSLLPH